MSRMPAVSSVKTRNSHARLESKSSNLCHNKGLRKLFSKIVWFSSFGFDVFQVIQNFDFYPVEWPGTSQKRYCSFDLVCTDSTTLDLYFIITLKTLVSEVSRKVFFAGVSGVLTLMKAIWTEDTQFTIYVACPGMWIRDLCKTNNSVYKKLRR